MMHILVGDLHKHRARVRQQVARKLDAVAQVREVAVHLEPPRVAVCLDHLRLARQRRIVAVAHVAPVRGGLEVRVVGDAVRRVDVDHLHLASHPLALEQRVHDEQGVAKDEAVRPVHVVVVEVNGLVERQPRVGEEAELLWFFAMRLRDDLRRRDALVDVQRDRIDGEAFGVALALARPHELRVEVRVVGVRLRLAVGTIVDCEPNLGVVLAGCLILRVLVRLDGVGSRALGLAWCPCHRSFAPFGLR